MAEVLRIAPQGQYSSGAMGIDMTEISNRLMTTTLDSIEEELKKDQLKDSEGPRSGSLHVPPRRAFTTSEYLLPTAPTSRATSPSASPRELIGRDSCFQLPPATSTHLAQPSRSPHLSSPAVSPGHPRTRTGAHGTTTPHRSYSVMDYEPVPFTHRPGTALRLCDLPAELHYALFDFLDPIDSVCLALTSRRFYAVHWNMHGKVSLAARREGPNDMEWVWRHAGPFLVRGSNNHKEKNNNNGGSSGGGQNLLAMLSPRGQVYCRKCRTARCELHKHIREWMGGGRLEEYCAVTEKFGPAAQDGARGFCYRSSPRHPNRCGRHTRNQRVVRLV